MGGHESNKLDRVVVCRGGGSLDAGEERVGTNVVKGKLCLVCRDGGGWALVNMRGRIGWGWIEWDEVHTGPMA
jgi:hypothetical protein